MKKVGIFDSGIGGLILAKEAISLRMNAELFYVSDDLFNPYGQLDEAQILERSIHCTELLIAQGVELITIACNTATAAAIKYLRENYKIPFVGIEPDLNFPNRELVGEKKDARFGVLTTSYTGKSEKFIELKKRRDPASNFQYIALENLARLVEEYFYDDSSELQKKIEHDLKSNLGADHFDYLVLGCTHYEYVQKLIAETYQCKCICPSKSVAKRMVGLLGKSYADSCGKLIKFYSTKEQSWGEFDMAKLDYWPR